MLPKEREIKKQIILKRKDIKRKLDILKHGELVHKTFFSPLTKHLENIETELTRKNRNNQEAVPLSSCSSSTTESSKCFTPITPKIKLEMEPFDFTPGIKTTKTFDLSDNQNDSMQSMSINPLQLQLQELKEEEKEEEEGKINKQKTMKFKHYDKKKTDFSTSRMQYVLEQYDTLPRKYISKMLKSNETDDDDDADDDNIYKPMIQFDVKRNKFYLGDLEIHIDGSDIIVNRKRYKGTPGLYELLFMKKPKAYTSNDEENYQQILLKSYMNKKGELERFKDILKPLSKKIGGGADILMKFSNKLINYVHWDDPNELVDRLKLLVASYDAGNTGVVNEINSIVEELREAKIII